MIIKLTNEIHDITIVCISILLAGNIHYNCMYMILLVHFPSLENCEISLLVDSCGWTSCLATHAMPGHLGTLATTKGTNVQVQCYCDNHISNISIYISNITLYYMELHTREWVEALVLFLHLPQSCVAP